MVCVYRSWEGVGVRACGRAFGIVLFLLRGGSGGVVPFTWLLSSIPELAVVVI